MDVDVECEGEVVEAIGSVKSRCDVERYKTDKMERQRVAYSTTYNP